MARCYIIYDNSGDDIAHILCLRYLSVVNFAIRDYTRAATHRMIGTGSSKKKFTYVDEDEKLAVILPHNKQRTKSSNFIAVFAVVVYFIDEEDHFDKEGRDF